MLQHHEMDNPHSQVVSGANACLSLGSISLRRRNPLTRISTLVPTTKSDRFGATGTCTCTGAGWLCAACCTCRCCCCARACTCAITGGGIVPVGTGFCGFATAAGIGAGVGTGAAGAGAMVGGAAVAARIGLGDFAADAGRLAVVVAWKGLMPEADAASAAAAAATFAFAFETAIRANSVDAAPPFVVDLTRTPKQIR